jgi:hypothetical protein
VVAIPLQLSNVRPGGKCKKQSHGDGLVREGGAGAAAAGVGEGGGAEVEEVAGAVAEEFFDHLGGELVLLRHAAVVGGGGLGLGRGLGDGGVAELHLAHPVGGVVGLAARFLLPDAQVGLLRVQAQARERLRLHAAAAARIVLGAARLRLRVLLLRLQVPPVQLRGQRGRQHLRVRALGRVRVVGEIRARAHPAHQPRRFVVRVRRILRRLKRPQPHPRLPETRKKKPKKKSAPNQLPKLPNTTTQPLRPSPLTSSNQCDSLHPKKNKKSSNQSQKIKCNASQLASS